MTGPYRRWIADYRDSGLHPFPVDGKQPCVRSYAARRPSLSAIERWSATFPNANLGLPTRRERLVVLDADDPAAIALFEEIVGYTPLRVRTRRGEHWYFRDLTGAVRTAIHPNGQAFDIKASGNADYILIPGSEHGGAIYRLADQDEVSVMEFAQRLKSLPPLDPAKLRNLMQQPRGLVRVRPITAHRGGTVILTGASIPVGARNDTLFKAACRDAHDVRRRFGDAEGGLADLVDRIQAFNNTLCVEPVPAPEVEKVAQSAWARTLSGVNRPPARQRRHIRDAMHRLGRQVRALALWGWLTQCGLDTNDIDLAPGRVAASIPGWKAHDAEAAIAALARAGVLRLLQAGGKGRGRAARYRLVESLVSDVSFAVGLQRLKGDAAALMLLVFLVDRWGDGSNAPISAEGMSQFVGGPFGDWTKVKIVKARDHLAAAGLIDRLETKRITARQPRAMFQMRAAAVLKIPGNVPVDIHRPPSRGALSGTGVRDSQQPADSVRAVGNRPKPRI